MNKRLALALLAMTLLTGWRWPFASEPTNLVLSCRNELVENRLVGEQQDRFYMIADFLLQGDRASINYRYFQQDGVPVGTLSMRGKVLDADLEEDVYALSLNESHILIEDEALPLPQHMAYLKSFSQRNMAEQGVHNLTLRLLHRNRESDYAIVFFLPSTAVCGCSVLDSDDGM
ncbi:hypothetical protein [Ferrimonas balearica]|uniref:hypothetical protein n=1 Tax=Ferrimonas balearica TaxID=44012 RepID=UPI001C58E6CC|nr:hypothetical protein [Ferrimonas balearica]MBW3138674.1 hypothetical protein [Ferrimonas balearica]MBW3163725.1 hypothetical protein [Ferrimonas balearica]MBY6105735.1 hypothetical protein [Ferrimonas balearica]MBY6223723.1 hypothetical protein [Ferrimonas balearica]